MNKITKQWIEKRFSKELDNFLYTARKIFFSFCPGYEIDLGKKEIARDYKEFQDIASDMEWSYEDLDEKISYECNNRNTPELWDEIKKIVKVIT